MSASFEEVRAGVSSGLVLQPKLRREISPVEMSAVQDGRPYLLRIRLSMHSFAPAAKRESLGRYQMVA